MQQAERVAIIGIGGIFPGAPDLERFWSNVAGGVDSTREVPAGRWLLDADDAYDPRVGLADHVYSTRGGFIEDFAFDADGLDIDPDFLDRLDPSVLLGLHAGHQAWRDAKIASLDRSRVGVVLGHIVLPTESASAIARDTLGRTFEELVGVGTTSRRGDSTDPWNAYVAGLPAGLLAQALGLGGGSYTLDAACASSLYALKLACDTLLAGRADAMLAGGLSRPDPLYTQMGFSQLRALAASGKPSPFDERGDGLVVGEGAGVFVLKRLGDAVRQGDKIYGVIAAVGLSNDVDGGLLAPSSEGQLRAMTSAYKQAGWDPREIDLIECHATGTPVGDAVEFKSLRDLWGGEGWSAGQCVIGSVKSNIGHALTAAGSAGLLKLLLALKHDTLPPTANFESPSPKLDYEPGPFRVLSESRPWSPRKAGQARRAAISGFGFGGINAHALIEEWIPPTAPARGEQAPALHTRSSPGGGSFAIVGMSAHFGPFRGLCAFQERVLGGDIPGGPAVLRNCWGLSQSSWFRNEGFGQLKPLGYAIKDLTLQSDRFRIPPRELEEMLPQQSLALLAAAEAIADAGWDDRPRLEAGVFVGIGLDLNTTNFNHRWSLLEKARAWNRDEGWGLTEEQLAEWVAALRDASGPALSANRTMGALGGLVASRIAREFRIGGPSFTVSGEETSGLRALEVAMRLLENREIDEAIVGAVDLACDFRAVLCTQQIQPFSNSGTVRPLGRGADGTVPGDGAGAVILKRLEDAERDGDRIYAVVKGLGAATGVDPSAYLSALDRCYNEADVEPASVEYLEANGSGRPAEDLLEASALAEFGRLWPSSSKCALGSAKGDVGHAGAASGLASLIKASLCLYQQMIPPLRGDDEVLAELGPERSPFIAPRGPQYWLRDRASGPRRAAVSSLGSDGNILHALLEAYEPQASIAYPDRFQPLGHRGSVLFAIEADDDEGLRRGLDELDALVVRESFSSLEALARRWWQLHGVDPSKRLGLALVAHEAKFRPILAAGRSVTDALFELTAEARQRLGTTDANRHARRRTDDRAFLTSGQFPPGSEVAFVFPGLGNQFSGMGRALSSLWPEVFRAQDAENGRLRGQLAPGTFWNEDPTDGFADHRPPILGQVTLGCLVSDMLLAFGLKPCAAIGYSLGESAALFALRAWTERDAMLHRINESPLFRTELAGPCDAARRAWGIPQGEPVEWVAGILPYPAEAVRKAIAGQELVYILIVNTASETVIGGDRRAVERAVQALGGRFFPLPLVSTIHCEVAREVEPAYRELHLLETTPPPGIRFYSGASSLPFIPDRESAADAVLAQAIHGIDYPAVIERAYADGVRFFIEAGPGGSCTRMIGKILEGRPHVALSACLPGHDQLTTVLDLLARLIAERVPVDLTPLYGPKELAAKTPSQGGGKPSRVIKVEVGGQPYRIPKPPTQGRRPTRPPSLPPSHEPVSRFDAEPIAPPRPPAIPHVASEPRFVQPTETPDISRNSGQVPPQVPNLAMLPTTDSQPLNRQVADSESARAEAHEAFLKISSDLSQTLANQLAFQMALIEALLDDPAGVASAHAHATPIQVEEHAPEPTLEAPVPALEAPAVPVALDRNQCLEFAIGSIGAVLGPEFAEIDAHPTRVRLPDEPLMLVDRILSIEGEPRSMQGGRVVTEHDVLRGAWYLDGGRIPTCIAVESGQADLFLSGYLGIDFITKGLAVYRLLDAVVTFHRSLPVPGDVIHYDIHIDHFFRQGETYLFRFHFEATVGGEPLMSMQDGCAGFFTAEALAAGQGIVAPRLERQTRTGGRPDDWEDFVSVGVESYDDHQVEALRRGDLEAAFGPQFAGLALRDPVRLPGGLMTLVHRVLELDPHGGKFGLGRIRAEADIDPEAWFMTCHFVDDRVMPGTLMFECCLHTLRIHLMRLGWVGEHDEIACEPIPGVASRLKCRGQVIESTRKVTYEVTIKELGYGPEPYAIVDALMYADGKPVVEISDMSLRMTGLSREALQRTWAGRQPQAGSALATRDVEPPALYDFNRILAFAVGNPSDAFGEPYRIFDSGRVIARLPGPPFQFLDRITAIQAEPWKLAAGGEIEARYDVPADAWYFAAEQDRHMPFAVLLEAALQPCGWLAAYLGSALTSDADLKFRNLGGSAVALEPVTPETGTLVTKIKITKVSRSAGMIIQNFDMEVQAQGRTIYKGDTYFGFFLAEALANQIGIRDAALYRPNPEELARAQSFAYPREAPFPDDRLRMIDQVDVFIPDGGPHGLGFIEGSQPVDPGTWYFQAHFYQDPVCPGSLGLESFLQLLKVKASERWGVGPESVFRFESSLPHRWMYRGQVLPTDRRVVVQATITEIDDRTRRLKADGFLTVDGRTIFQMNDFTLGVD
ncbi:beta-ketoacyl synthase N-terminal-like domain-containing protein [Singulisphaera sp. PoT]|uniref:beta-ketoacyl synthase N-terminal-like domain-containing protein n=1 Tax=Singulisphaera sp. PoT TaxID=3411797 RepID=UPI003BF525FC